MKKTIISLCGVMFTLMVSLNVNTTSIENDKVVLTLSGLIKQAAAFNETGLIDFRDPLGIGKYGSNSGNVLNEGSMKIGSESEDIIITCSVKIDEYSNGEGHADVNATTNWGAGSAGGNVGGSVNGGTRTTGTRTYQFTGVNCIPRVALVLVCIPHMPACS